ncbi:hypothetical protein [Mycobacterium sp. MFM001]|uniref:hypothetical protein n=1 Tax=Mycobacterium sp. MFM001 TaxID=2049453 RepID=UPI00135A0FD9|nr:hypothetical protein [Mycobacterium sp. MFM001]
MAAALRSAAGQFVPLAKQTPHRVIRELYEQTIAYKRAYADSIATYSGHDDQLIRTANGIDAALMGICEAITYGSASARSLLVAASPAPSRTAPVGDLASPSRFLTSPDAICADWVQATSQLDADTAAWRAIDSSIPATQWTPEQKDVNDNASQAMLAFADKANGLAQQTNNPIMQDFVFLAAQYQRVYAKALPTYTSADGYLSNAGMNAGGAVRAACRTVGS